MRRALGYTLAWCGATALAVGVSWLGVRDVLRSAILDDAPLAPVVAVAGPPSPSSASVAPGLITPGTPAPVTTTGPVTKRLPSPVRRTPIASRSSGRPGQVRPLPQQRSRLARQVPSTPPTTVASPPPSKSVGETLHTFTLKGGRATIVVTAKDCRVVSASPNEGYEVKIWETEYWLRVAFLRGTRESSAFCTWNTLPPRLDTYEA